MKKVILVAVMAMVSLASCKKDDIKPNVVQFGEVKDCDCGSVTQITKITSVSIPHIEGGGFKYSVTIENWCSNNTREEELLRTKNQGPAYIGEGICFSEPW